VEVHRFSDLSDHHPTHAKPYSVGSVSDLSAFCQTMRKELASASSTTHLMALDGVPMKSLFLATDAKPYSVGSGSEQVVPTAMIRYMVVVLAR
jgi:hypothetical protein